MNDYNHNRLLASQYTQLFWNEYILNPDSIEYNLILDQELYGNLDIERIKKTIEILHDKYNLLSMNLFQEDERLYWIDKKNKPKLKISNNINELINNIKAPFKLEDDCLVRYFLIENDDNHFSFIAVLHHVIIDGLSGQEFYNAISNIYNNINEKHTPLLSNNRIESKFIEYNESVKLLINRHDSISFWKKTLKMCSEKVDLPFIKSNAINGSESGEIRFNLKNNQWEKLKKGIKYANHFLVFKTFWTILIGRYTGQQTVYINYPIAVDGGAALSFGAQVNTAIFPLTFDDKKTFLDYYQDTINYSRSLKITGKLRHSALPIYEVLAATQVKETGVSFSQAYLKDSPLQLEGCEAKVNARFNNDMAGSTLILEYQQQGDDFNFRIRYKKALFHPQQIEDMANNLQGLIDMVSINPHAVLSEYPLVSTSYQHLLTDNSTIENNYDRTLISLFDNMVQQYPNQLALSFNGSSLTYLELQQQTNSLAHYLQATYQQHTGCSLPKNILIPFLHHRGLHPIVAMLSIMRAGAGYVPLDPQMPEERIKWILQDINSPIILIDPQFEAQIKAIVPQSVCIYTNKPTQWLNQTSIPLIDKAEPDSIAYAIYTSGTTGRPKGTLLPHRGPISMLDGVKANLAPRNVTRCHVLQFSSFLFDAHVLEVFYALTSGSHLFITDELERKDLSLLLAKMASWEINFTILPPSLLSNKPAFPPSLHTLCAGGEAMSQDTVDFYQNSAVNLINMYGPTEASVLITMNIGCQGGARNLGHALPGCHLFVTDSKLNLQPIGVWGELCISGPALANMYLNQPEQTAQKFVANPYSDHRLYQRVYRTGDVVRQLPDGSFEYLGRNDHQVKVNGHRIELDEIENALRSHPNIIEAKVAIRSIPQNCICGWYMTDNADISAIDIQQYLSRYLPHYMVPQALMSIDAFPLTISGKIDLNALRTPDFINTHTIWRDARTPLEKKILACFTQSLKNTQLGIDDNFYRCGGNSILAMRCCHEISKATGYHLPVHILTTNPTVALLNDYFLSIKTESAPDNIIKAKKQDKIPLSFQQSRLWFVDRLDEGKTHYLSPILLKLSSECIIEHFATALQQLVSRHHILQSVIYQDEQGKAWLQHINEKIDIQHVYLTEDEYPQFIDKMLSTAIDLTSELPINATFIHHTTMEGEQCCDCLLVMHHIVTDGWSRDILIRELAHFYNQNVNDNSSISPLPELEIQYADYALWQQNQKNASTELLDFWHQHLDNYQQLDLPIDFIRPHQFDIKGDNFEFTIPETLNQSLKNIATQEGITLYSVMLAGFMMMLSRYCDQDDIIVGIPLANRHHPQLENLIGFFVNTLPIRLHTNQDITVNQLVKHTFQTLQDIQLHQELPFDHLVDSFQSSRDLSRNPLFQVMFALEQDESHQLPNWMQLADLSHYDHSAKYDLNLTIHQSETAVKGVFNYAVSLFQANTIKLLASYYIDILESMVREYNSPIQTLSLIDKQQYQISSVTQEYEYKRPMYSDFVELAAMQPEQIAVIDCEGSMTYSELYHSALFLSSQLREHAQISGDAIAVLLSKGRVQPIALLAILMSGKAFLPMDLSWPIERRMSIMRQAGINTIICDSEDNYDNDIQSYLINIKGNISNLSHPTTLMPPANVAPTDLAYIIYTSGSTGTPKGVAIEHLGAVNTIEGCKRLYSLGTQDRSLALSALSFDLSIYDIFAPLSSGGAIVIPAEEERYSPACWYNLMVEHQVTMWLSAPAMMELLVNYMNQCSNITGLPALRLALIGGDWISIELPEKLRAKASNCAIYSAGGATEASIFSILYLIPDAPILTSSIPYGKALPHQSFFILDRQLNPVPTGVRGEIYIGGVGLAREYFGDPQRTEESFIYHSGLKQRLYRTGDMGRWLADGNIEFMGRRDFQIKLNGYRIELGEIENVLLGHPDIDETCAWVVETPEKTLVAWYVSKQPVEHDELVNLASEFLPHYMLPKHYVWLSALPLNENGKIVRKHLPLPKIVENSYCAPENDFEEKCVVIWENILKQKNISVTRNFFELGGNSLLAIQACYQMNQVANSQITLTDFAQCTGIRAIYQRHLEQKSINTQSNIEASGSQRHPMSSMQKQLWFIEHLNGSNELYHVPLLLKVDADCNWKLLQQSIEMVTARHQTLCSLFEQNNLGEYVSYQASSSMKVTEQSLTAHEWEQLLPALINKPFNLSCDIPVRGGIYHCKFDSQTENHYVLFVFHHISFDGTSIPVLLQDLDQHYQSLTSSSESQITPLPIQYGDYARWQQDQLNSAYLEDTQQWWKKNLEASQPLTLPLDFVRPAQFNHQGANHTFSIPTELVSEVKRVAQQEGITPFAVYLSSFNLLLSLFSGQQDIIVGTPIAHRPTPSTQSLIGFFVNALPIRSQIDDEITLANLRRQIFEHILEVGQYQLPLESLVDILNVPRDLAINPLFQVMFIYEPSLTDAFPTWLTIEPIIDKYEMAKFDLTLNVTEKDGESFAVFNYGTSLFKPETIRYLADYYISVLKQSIAGNCIKVNEVTLISPEQTAMMKKEWQQQVEQYPYRRAIWQDFVYQVDLQPDSTAIIDNLGEMTYRQLYQAAMTLAGQLSSSSAMDGDTIGVLVDKGRAQIIAILACSFAGKPYLPMDKSWPIGRCNDVLEQANARLVISSHQWEFHPHISVVTISKYGSVAQLPINSDYGQPATVKPDDLAYVIFTSGSTGKPKGVAVKHSGAVNSIVDTLKKMNINSQDRFFAISAISFDISVFDIFGALSAGASIVMPDESERYTPSIWAQLIQDHQVSFWNSAPSVMSLLVEYLESTNIADTLPIDKVVLVGEIIPKALPQRIRHFSPESLVVSTGGATESSIWSIYYEIPTEEIDGPSIPYGKAMAHQRFYILDKQLRPLPCCIPGEQYIAGEGVAQCYFNNETLTNERFIWHEGLGERLYRTGDVGRWLPDGNMEFLGRVDFQVKLNGYRVELGEVESIALRTGKISACCAVVHHSSSLQQLVLYYVPNENFDESSLLTGMSQYLPLYMLPSQLIALEALPYNSSGKLDRAALPVPDEQLKRQYVAPKDSQQKKLCQLWQEILKIDQVGITDDYFELGGTSLKAAIICQHMSIILGKTLTVISLFQYRTIEKLLAINNRTLCWELNKPTVNAPVLWMIHPALAGAEVFTDFAEAAQGKIHCLGIDNYNLYHEPTIDQLSVLASRYRKEIEQNEYYDKDQPIHILGWSLGGVIALEIASQLEHQGVKDISLWLLDSFYQQTVNKPISRIELLSAIGITGETAQRALNIESIEESIAASAISKKLSTTRVTLFKALNPHSKLDKKMMLPLIENPNNGLITACQNLNVLPLNCNHYDIIEKHQDIINQILFLE